MSWRFPRTRPQLEGSPVVVTHDGRLREDVMRYERLPDTELHEALREQGIDDLSTVRIGVLEPDGRLSSFTDAQHPPGQERPVT